MKLTNRELTERARGELPGHYTTLVPAEILNGLIGLIAGSIFTGGGYLLSMLISLVVSLLLGVLSTGFHYIYLQLARGNDVRISDLFYCFTHHPDKVIIIELILYLLSLAVSIPFVLLWYLVNFRNITAMVICSLLCLIGWAAALIAIRMPFLIVYDLYVDHPGWDAFALLLESRGRMAGQLKDAWLLLLRFAGYALLGLLSLGIGFLWIAPYMRMTFTEFYLERT